MEFHVPDMTCGHCASRVTAALRSLDPAVLVEVDLAAHRVVVKGQIEAASALDAMTAAGFTPTLVAKDSG